MRNSFPAHASRPHDLQRAPITGGTNRRTIAARAGSLLGLALVGLVASSAGAQERGSTIVEGRPGRRLVDTTPGFQVRFLDETGGTALSAPLPTGIRPLAGGTLFRIDDTLGAMTSTAANPAGRTRGVAESAETFVLELASPVVAMPESVGRIGANGPRYSFTPQGLTITWPASKPVDREHDRFKWDGYLRHNLTLLACLHGKRILFEEKTRRGLREPWLRQWRDDIGAIPRSWGDQDGFVTNYVGHPMMGAVMGHLQVLNHPAHARLEFADRGYWHARGVTLVAAAVASTQFEIGPLSEATTGLHPSKQGLSDFVITPLLGTAWIVGEDALDRYVIVKLEARQRPLSRRLLRCALNPSRSIANLVAMRAPWRRDTRAD